MHKPLQVTFWARLRHLVRGLLFYNTVYWRRASDGLNPPKLSREERLSHQPSLDPAIIRPREKPRAKIAAQADDNAPIPRPAGFIPADDPVTPRSFAKLVPPAPVESMPEEAPAGERYVKRRRRRRRRQVEHRSGGFFSRLFRKE